MANEIQLTFMPGKQTYFLVRNRNGLVWNGSAFVTYSTTDYANYAVSCTEQGSASGFYAGNFPTSIIPGVYSIVAKQQLGGSVQETDPTISVGNEEWSGTNTLPLSDLATSGQLAHFLPIEIAKGEMLSPFNFKLVSSADHVTPFTSGVVSGQIAKNRGSFGPLQSGEFLEQGLGWYSLQALTSGDLNANIVNLVFTANGISGGTSDQRDFSIVLQRTSG